MSKYSSDLGGALKSMGRSAKGIKSADKAFAKATKRRAEAKKRREKLNAQARKERQIADIQAKAQATLTRIRTMGMIVPDHILKKLNNPPSGKAQQKTIDKYGEVLSASNLRQSSYLEVIIPGGGTVDFFDKLKRETVTVNLPDVYVKVPYKDRNRVEEMVYRKFRQDAMAARKREKEARAARRAWAERRGMPAPTEQLGVTEMLETFIGRKTLPSASELAKQFPINIVPMRDTEGQYVVEGYSSLLALYQLPDDKKTINYGAKEAIKAKRREITISTIATDPVFAGDRAQAERFLGRAEKNPAWQRFRQAGPKGWQVYEETKSEIMEMMSMSHIPNSVISGALTYALDRHTTADDIIQGMRDYIADPDNDPNGKGYKV